jgi:uncharacterized protein YacL
MSRRKLKARANLSTIGFLISPLTSPVSHRLRREIRIMRLTATVVVEIGALICLSGTLLLAELELSPHEIAFLRALVAIILGLFFMQIGYAQSLREKQRSEPEERPKNRHNPE